MSKYLSAAQFRPYVEERGRRLFGKPMPASDAHRVADSRDFRNAASRQGFSGFANFGVARIVPAGKVSRA